jgi:hypothetical protein
MSTKYKIVLAVLGILGLAAGYFGGMAYSGIKGAIGGMTTACHMLRVGEQAGIFTAAQRSAIVDDFLKKLDEKSKGSSADKSGEKMISDGMRGDCKLIKFE